MPTCSNPLPRTQFLGATIGQFQASIGWNGNQGELTTQVIEDKCIGGGAAYEDSGNGIVYIATDDNFNPPPLGYPVTFRYGGFSYSGILQNWKEDDSATGIKSYSLRVTDPRELLEGTQLILHNYVGQTFNMPNLVNVYGFLEEVMGASCPEFTNSWYPPMGFNIVMRYAPSAGFGGADDRGGLPWWQIRGALSFLLNQVGNRFGQKLSYRDHLYSVDISDLPNLDDWIRFNVDSMSLADLIHEVCELSSHDYFFTLINHNTIKVNCVSRVSQIEDHSAMMIDTAVGTPVDQRLSQGHIGGTVGSVDGLEAKARGIELRTAFTNSFLVGEYRQDVWQTSYMGGTDSSSTIWPYWGKDENGNVIAGQGIAYEFTPCEIEHIFTVPMAPWGIPGTEAWSWQITSTDLRFALEGETMWRNFALARQPMLAPQAFLAVEDELPDWNTFHARCQRAGVARPMHIAAAGKQQAKLADKEGEIWKRFSSVYEHIHQYASTYFGRKFLVRLPYLCAKLDDNTPFTIQTNWQIARDGGWFEGHCLGLMPGSVYLEAFRQDDGKIVPFVGFQSSHPLDMSNIGNKDDYIQVNPYTAYVKCTVEEIINVGVGDWRAVISLPGIVTQYWPHPTLDQVLGIWTMLRARYGVNKIRDDMLWKIAKTPGADKFQYRLPPLPLMPMAAAVPLQSTRLVYGPWAAGIGDLTGASTNSAGKTAYQRNSDFAPWNFGSVTRMNAAGDALVSSNLSDHYVIEQGAITIPDAPACSLGVALFYGGPLVTRMDIRVSGDTSTVNTQYNMKTYTPDFGKLGQQFVSAIKRGGIWAHKINRMFRKFALEKQRAILDQVNDAWKQRSRWSVRYSAQSSHDIIMGCSLSDPDSAGGYQTQVSMTELRKALPELVASNDEMYATRALMDMNGLLRPFGTNSIDKYAAAIPCFERSTAISSSSETAMKQHTMFYSKEQGPIICKEPFLPITVETLSPFLGSNLAINGLSLGSSGKGHDIEYVARDAIYPTHLSVRQPEDNYSVDHRYRAFALRGPLVIAGWGYDTNNKPVPNASSAYPQNPTLKFATNWLRRPDSWKVGPVDLRWDERRKVWTAPSPIKILKVVLKGPSLPGYATIATPMDEAPVYDSNGNIVYDTDIPVWNHGCRPVLPGVWVLCYWDTHLERYYIFNSNDPLISAKLITGLVPGGTSVGIINNAIGCTTDAINGKTCFISSALGQPICPNQNIYGYIYNAVPTQWSYICNAPCVTDCIYYITPIQAQFNPLTVVTEIEFKECDGYNYTTPTACITGGDVTIDCVDDYGLGLCYCDCTANTSDMTVSINPFKDKWKYYTLCVKRRTIYLQAAYSNEVANCQPTQSGTPTIPSGWDCVPSFATCYCPCTGVMPDISESENPCMSDGKPKPLLQAYVPISKKGCGCQGGD